MIYTYKYNSNWQLTNQGLYCNVANNNTYHAEYIPVDMSKYDYYADTRITITGTNSAYIGWYTYDAEKSVYPSTNYYEYVVSNYAGPCTNQRFIKQMFNISHPDVKFIRTRLLNNYKSVGTEGCSITIHSLRLIEVPKGTKINTNKNGQLKASDFREFDNVVASMGQSHLIEGVQLYEY